jgi:hypothetical protein
MAIFEFMHGDLLHAWEVVVWRHAHRLAPL